jgi:hypothetical protein
MHRSSAARKAFVGLSDDATRPRTWLCPACREAI